MNFLGFVVSSFDYGDLANTCLRGPQVKVVMPQLGLHKIFVGFSCSYFVLDKLLVVLVPQKTMVDKFLWVFELIVS